MPDLGNLLNSSSLTLSRCPNLKLDSDQCDSCCSLYPETLASEGNWGCDLPFSIGHMCNGHGIRVFKGNRGSVERGKKPSGTKNLDADVKAWVAKKVESGVPEHKCFLPFLVGAPKLVDCRVCQNFIYPGEEVLCSVSDCQAVFHATCAKEKACFLCKQKSYWRCARCMLASHDKCAAFPEGVIHLKTQPGLAICWRHPTDWRLEKMHAAPTSNIEEIFCRLPLPYMEEEFKIDFTWKDMMENKMEPPPFVHIRRNVYLIKKKRNDADADAGIGCTNCSSTKCSEDCVCRVQCISCSKACRCSEMCTNRPFRKEKKVKIVKTEFCGWGVEAAESINEGDFVIEYIGEVIDDAMCEQRLWDMKYRGVNNFYMCELRKDFTIDATFKGNSSRFLNHSCDPNCKLEKWHVEGETRVGVFAARSIKVGEPLTYDYRFVQFGPEVKCHCAAPNCQGYLGTKRKIGKIDICWGSKRRRTPIISCLLTNPKIVISTSNLLGEA
ncbi:histone-lysine N-methyltransferase ASHR3 isoform X2 [Actinidia eriantha]|uniref:histone-lysine N-methyltransferase ASHR3 isoform X2 n=1 Tax=Actinidia eriantha TaxID=165200 RepID=UPI0025827E36|nr:histone-lysine N-methyltransferase ASHR3 isoform X2 [Actinidia eriantha]